MPERTITRLLNAWSHGDEAAHHRLAPLVYRELELLAARYLRREHAAHTLQTRVLVHEAYLRLVDQRRVSWQGRSHFFGIAAQMMRRVLVDHARQRRYARRGRGAVHMVLDEAAVVTPEAAPDVVAVHDALTDLAAHYPEAARIVELRFFGGFGESEIAEMVGLSVPTVKRRWRLARAWLYRHFNGRASDDS